jgi:hypothetical protein
MTVTVKTAAPAVERRSFHASIRAREARAIRQLADELEEARGRVPAGSEARAAMAAFVTELHDEARALER